MNPLSRIKIQFVITVLLLAVSISVGSFSLRGIAPVVVLSTTQSATALKYRSQLADTNMLAAVLQPLSSGVLYKRQSLAQAVPVLSYHGIVKTPDGSNVTRENFVEQMMALKKAGYETISVNQLFHFLQDELELNEKSFLLTFDDARKDSYYPVDPLLKALDYSAVMFIITEHSIGPTESNFYLSERELKRMLRSGRWELQSHGKNNHEFHPIDAYGNEGHFLSNLLWIEDAQRLETPSEYRARIYMDLLTAKEELVAAFGDGVISYAYPFGDFGQDTENFPGARTVIEDVVSSIYPFAFYQVYSGYAGNYPGSDFMIKRISVSPEWTGADLLNIIEGEKL